MVKPDAIVWRGDVELPLTQQGIRVFGAPISRTEFVVVQLKAKIQHEVLFQRIVAVQGGHPSLLVAPSDVLVQPWPISVKLAATSACERRGDWEGGGVCTTRGGTAGAQFSKPCRSVVNTAEANGKAQKSALEVQVTEVIARAKKCVAALDVQRGQEMASLEEGRARLIRLESAVLEA